MESDELKPQPATEHPATLSEPELLMAMDRLRSRQRLGLAIVAGMLAAIAGIFFKNKKNFFCMHGKYFFSHVFIWYLQMASNKCTTATSTLQIGSDCSQIPSPNPLNGQSRFS